MLSLRQLLPSQLLTHISSPLLERACEAASFPALTQLWNSQLQQSCCMATAKTDAQPAPKIITRHERRVLNYQYCKKRAAWRREVGALRQQWLQEYGGRIVAAKQADEAVREQLKKLRELRAANTVQEDRTKQSLERRLRMAERRVDVAARRYASAMREDLRQQTLQQFRDRQRSHLIKQSRNWIRPDQLEERIAAALDNPSHM